MPAWEDTANKNGGKWAIQVPRDRTKSQIDKMWLYTVCATSLCVLAENDESRCWRRSERRSRHLYRQKTSPSPSPAKVT